MNENIQKASQAIASTDPLFISAGAGMGVDSGLPDFRGNEGFWKAYPLLGEGKISFSRLANPVWFGKAPERAWGFYGHRFNLYKATQPHQGFEILLKWSRSKNMNAFVFTSNVDGHFQKVGFSENQVHECHGSINYLQCRYQCHENIWHSEKLECEIDTERLRASGELPTCPKCGEIARPNILMFGDFGWLSHRANEQIRNQNLWLQKNTNANIVTIEMGAGKAVPTVRRMSESMNSTLIRINPRDEDGPAGTISIPLGALEALTKIDKLL